MDGSLDETMSQLMTTEERGLLKNSFGRIKLKFKRFTNPLSAKENDDASPSTEGLKGIDEMLDNYSTFKEYLDDVSRLVKVYSQRYRADQRVLKEARIFEEDCKHDINSIIECSECFQNWLKDRVGYFLEVCAKPHLLAMVKLGYYPYWPAKVMSVNGDNVRVEFFGEHTRAEVSASNCHLYRKPSKRSKNADFNASIKEAEDHIKRIKQKFGSFVPARKIHENFDAEKLNDHLRTMFPGAYTAAINDRPRRLLSIDSHVEDQTSTVDHDDSHVEDQTSTVDHDVSLDMPSLATTPEVNETLLTPVRSNRKRRVTFEPASTEEASGKKRKGNEQEASSPPFSPHRSITKTEKIRRLQEELGAVHTQLNEANQEIKRQHEQILSLKEQLVTFSNGLECANCGNAPHDLFFCSPECQNDYQPGNDSDSNSDSD